MLRVNEAIARAERMGKKVTKKELAAHIWPDSSEDSRGIALTQLCKGNKKFVDPEWVLTICEVLNCTPNYLFGYENED